MCTITGCYRYRFPYPRQRNATPLRDQPTPPSPVVIVTNDVTGPLTKYQKHVAHFSCFWRCLIEAFWISMNDVVKGPTFQSLLQGVSPGCIYKFNNVGIIKDEI